MRNRDNRIQLRLSDTELAAFDQKVQKCGMSREAYIRALISGITPTERPSAEVYDLLMELRRIGLNINQIAAKANSTGEIDSTRFQEEADALRELRNKIVGRLFS